MNNEHVIFHTYQGVYVLCKNTNRVRKYKSSTYNSFKYTKFLKLYSASFLIRL